METRIPSGVLEFDGWLNASLAEAETLVAPLLVLPAARLRRELRTRPELRTPGVLKRLLAVARESLHELPSRTHEITLLVARYARAMDVPPSFAFFVHTVQGEAWRDHARALREVGRPEKAMHALRVARRFFHDVPGTAIYLATVDLVEAPLLHERGLQREALRMIRDAARRFGLSRDHGQFLEARTVESWMLWAAGDYDGAGEVWTATERAARARGDSGLLARVAAKMGVFQLRYGSRAEASRLLAAALELFDANDPTEDPIRTRWHLAQAAAEGGRLLAAIAEYHMVSAQLLKRGSLVDSAVAAVDVLDLLLRAGREEQLPSVLTSFVRTFRDAGMTVNAMEAFAWLRGRADAGCLTREDVLVARRFFEDLAPQPYARFRALASPTRSA